MSISNSNKSDFLHNKYKNAINLWQVYYSSLSDSGGNVDVFSVMLSFDMILI